MIAYLIFKHTATFAKPVTLSPPPPKTFQVPAITITAALTAALTAPMVYAHHLSAATQQQVVIAFNLGLPCLALIWMLSPGGARPGNAAAARSHRAVACLGFALHVVSVVDLLYAFSGDYRAAGSALADVFWIRSTEVMPANFMQWDMLGLRGASIIFLLAEEGPAGVVRYLVGAALLGPGAGFALACARREERLIRGAARAPPAAAGAGEGGRKKRA